MNWWTKNGALDRVFEQLQLGQIERIRVEAFSIDSTSVKVHPDGTGALKKNGSQAIGKSRGGWNTKIHMVAADARAAVVFALSPGSDHDAPLEGLLEELGPMSEGLPLLMDRTYEGNATRQLVLDLAMIPVVPPRSNRLNPWDYDHATYKKRNEIEPTVPPTQRLPSNLLSLRKTRRPFLGFLSFALIVEACA